MNLSDLDLPDVGPVERKPRRRAVLVDGFWFNEVVNEAQVRRHIARLLALLDYSEQRREEQERQDSPRDLRSAQNKEAREVPAAPNSSC
jgi:hypothetical protein